ncbi:hypothetical protein LZ554_006432 [Drepanopeziza brunnea f. sp. 'monogermtubi']|nr:hypothetical protein LZ554_006432 [Drepanopeziza brunnea f. sp. 'monogermtubi']
MSLSNPPIHILGLGNLGRLFAHALAIQPTPPKLTLLFHRPSLFAEWAAAGSKIRITTTRDTLSNPSRDNCITTQSSNYSIEPTDQATNSTIKNLIITTKAPHTVSALRPIAHRLNAQSTLLFAQNGMGALEEVNETYFPDPSTRPRYLAAVTSHGVYSRGPFHSVHAGLANITIGPVSPPPSRLTTTKSTKEKEKLPDSDSNSDSDTRHFLLDHITANPTLHATAVPAHELLPLQLEKLVVNACINPLTALLNLPNGDLFFTPTTPTSTAGTTSTTLALIHLLVAESSTILLALPELQAASAATRARFAPRPLRETVAAVGAKTARNVSSMLQDVRAGRPTEIEYITGYLVRRAREVGVECGNHEVLMRMVREGRQEEVQGGCGAGLARWFPDVENVVLEND